MTTKKMKRNHKTWLHVFRFDNYVRQEALDQYQQDNNCRPVEIQQTAVYRNFYSDGRHTSAEIMLTVLYEADAGTED